jgi:hypothetical protein
VPKGTKKNLLGILQHENGIHAVDLYIAIPQGPDAVTVAHGDRRPELVISHCLSSLTNDPGAIERHTTVIQTGKASRPHPFDLYRMILHETTNVKNRRKPRVPGTCRISRPDDNIVVRSEGPVDNHRRGFLTIVESKDASFDYDPFYQQHLGMQSLTRGANWPNFSNTFSYYSPALGGFDAGLQYSLSGVPGQFNSAKSDGLQLIFHYSTFSVRTIYEEVRDPNGQHSNLFTAQKQLFLGYI